MSLNGIGSFLFLLSAPLPITLLPTSPSQPPLPAKQELGVVRTKNISLNPLMTMECWFNQGSLFYFLQMAMLGTPPMN